MLLIGLQETKSPSALKYVGMLKDGVNGVDGLDYAYSLSSPRMETTPPYIIMVMIQ